LYRVGQIFLIAGVIVCVVLLIKSGFDRAETRDKRKKDDKKARAVSAAPEQSRSTILPQHWCAACVAGPLIPHVQLSQPLPDRNTAR
jgi:hypothetical protein